MSNGVAACFPPNLSRTPGCTSRLNPGNLTDLHRQFRSIAPVWFEGMQCAVSRQLSPNLALFFASQLSHTSPCGVRLGGQYSRRSADDDNVLRSPFVQADINPSSMCTNLAVMYQPLSWLRSELTAQLEPLAIGGGDGCRLVSSNGLRIDLLGKRGTATAYAWNVERNSGRLALAYLHSVTARLSLGAELCTEWRTGDTTDTSSALVFRYAKDNVCLSGSASMHAFDVSYWRHLHNNVQMGSSVVYNERSKSAVGSIVYQWLFPDSVVRGMIDSECSTGFTYTRRIANMCCDMGISVLFCVPTNKFACGLKFDFDANDKWW